jgi:hypothetical protein
MFLTFLLFLFTPGEPLLENRFFGVLVLKLVGSTGFDDSLRDTELLGLLTDGRDVVEFTLLGLLTDGRDVVEFTLLGIGGRMIGGAGMLSFVERLFRPEFGGADGRLVLPGGDFALLMFVVFVGDTLLVLTDAVFLMFKGGILLIMLGARRSMLVDVNWFCLLDVSDFNGMSFEFVGGLGLARIAAFSVLIRFSAVASVGIMLPPETNALRRGMLFIFELLHPFFLRTVAMARETICHLLLV